MRSILAAAGVTAMAAGWGVLALASPQDRSSSALHVARPDVVPIASSAASETLDEKLQALRALRRERLESGELRLMRPSPTRRSAQRIAADRGRTLAPDDDLRCLTEAVYYEARGESEEGRLAVAQVVVNRTREPGYPHTICGVVYEHHPGARTCQFSFTCDGSMQRDVDRTAWSNAESVARRVLGGETSGLAATHYHADYVQPFWSNAFSVVRRIGRHVFYDGRGDRSRGDAG